MKVTHAGIVAIMPARRPSAIDLSCGFQSSRPAGTFSRTRFVRAASRSSSPRSCSVSVIPRSWIKFRRMQLELFLRAPTADDDREWRAAPWHIHGEAGAFKKAELVCERHVRVLVGPRLVDSSSPCPAAERLGEMREPEVEIA